MKRIIYIFAAMALMVVSACSAPSATNSAQATVAVEPEVVVFADPVLEARVRGAMGRPENDITAAEAAAVKEMNFGAGLQQQISGEAQIRNLGGLEYFKNLESLDLSFHAVTDISPLAGLNKLTSLSLGGNPVADISPLSGMTSLRALTLSGCAAQDYSPLSGLVNLEFLMLDDSAITDLSVLSGLTGLTYLNLAHTQVSDVSPLAALTGLKRLYLSDCSIATYSPLADICMSLEDKDFTMVSSLSELGFTRSDNSVLASYNAEGLSVTINHSEWGIPAMEAENNSVKMYLQLDNGYGLIVLYYPEIDVYVFQITVNNQMLINYIYDPENGEFTFGSDSRESTEQVLKDALGETSSGDILLAPIPIFNDTIQSTFGMTADALYALPLEPLTLKSLGFTADEANAVCIYTEHEGTFTSIEVHRPEWGEKEYDVRFFTPINDYGQSVMGLIVMYDADEQRFRVTGYLDETSYAEFDYYIEDGSTIDGNVSGANTVKEYFINMYNDPAITDIYTYSVQLVEGYIYDTFGMSIEELYALPVGE